MSLAKLTQVSVRGTLKGVEQVLRYNTRVEFGSWFRSFDKKAQQDSDLCFASSTDAVTKILVMD